MCYISSSLSFRIGLSHRHRVSVDCQKPMMVENRGKVVRRLWFILYCFECCYFVLMSSTNVLLGWMYWKLLSWHNTIQATLGDNAASIILATLMLGVFASLVSVARLVCWRWAGKEERRLQLF